MTIRVPQSWSGRVSSRTLRMWLREQARNSRPLPDDPGPGPVRLSLAVPRQPLATLAAGLGSESEFLRRLIAARLPADVSEAPAREKPRWLWGALAAVFIFFVLRKSTAGTVKPVL
jgi:hypothetical protein